MADEKNLPEVLENFWRMKCWAKKTFWVLEGRKLCWKLHVMLTISKVWGKLENWQPQKNDKLITEHYAVLEILRWTNTKWKRWWKKFFCEGSCTQSKKMLKKLIEGFTVLARAFKRDYQRKCDKSKCMWCSDDFSKMKTKTYKKCNRKEWKAGTVVKKRIAAPLKRKD